ncbi:acyltransferase [Acinetobacter guillouiae]|uniref:acyltransferase n=1 Tax=Acinetobacter guillouiae TaxID=106649 RepID=UPI001250535B|nr:acyltransferase [Acinetobacter guillouiae]
MINSVKVFLLKKIYKNHVFFRGEVKILGQLPYFKLPKNGKIFLGNQVVLNSDFKNTNTALTYRCKFVTGYDGIIKIGNNTMLNGVCIVSYKNVEIGDECQIASSTIISDTDFHPVDPILRSKQVKGENFPFSSVGKKEIKIGNNVWIGWNCTILKGVEIGDNSIVAAGSVVLAGSYPNGSLIAGNPAKVIKSYI